MNIENQKSKIGQLPGSIVYTGDDKSKDIKIELITYENESVKSEELNSIEEVNLDETDKLKWIKVTGLNNNEIIRSIGEKLNLSDLILEDIVNVSHTPKVEFHDHCLFLILKSLSFDLEELCLDIDHVSFVLLDNLLVSFEEYENNVFNRRQETLKENNIAVRKRKTDYLLYSLMDALIDQYFIVIDSLEEKMEELELDVLDKYDKEQLYTVYKLRKEMSKLKRVVWPVEGVVKAIIREEDRIDKRNIKYFKEINDNLIQLIDFINMDREIILGLFDLYLSNNDNKMNRAMQTLTVIATIFTPLTFLTGVYGMNFKYMPELYYKFSYPIFWLIAILNFTVLYRYYKKKGWI